MKSNKKKGNPNRKKKDSRKKGKSSYSMMLVKKVCKCNTPTVCSYDGVNACAVCGRGL